MSILETMLDFDKALRKCNVEKIEALYYAFMAEFAKQKLTINEVRTLLGSILTEVGKREEELTANQIFVEPPDTRIKEQGNESN